MAKPIIKTIPAFDATRGTTIEFVYNGNMAYNNTMVIYDAETQRRIYDHTYSKEHYRLDHEIPAGLLQNDRKYAATIRVVDISGSGSSVSDKLYFWTISTPDFKFKGLKLDEDNKVFNSSLTLSLQYSHENLESLSWIRFHLYNDHKQPLQETDEDYTNGLEYTFKALENDSVYYVRATGVTMRGIELDTGYYKICTHYQNPNAYTRINAVVDERTGFVNYSSNLVVISPTKDDYHYDDGHIDLTTVDLKRQLEIRTDCELEPALDVHWNTTAGRFEISETAHGNRGITIQSYRDVGQIVIYGASSQQTVKKPGEEVELKNILGCDLYVDGKLLPNINDGFRLSKLPYVGADKLVIYNDGSRKLFRRVGSYTFTNVDAAVKTEKYPDSFITWYSVGGKQNTNANNLMCSCLPIMSDSRTHINIDPATGFIKITWLNDSGVTDEEDARAYFANHQVVVQYLLAEEEIQILDSIVLPTMIDNHDFVRYDNNFIIPENATFKMKMRNCRRNAKFLKIMSDDQNGLTLCGVVYEDFAYRFKLIVHNPGGSNSIQYSQALTIDHNDMVSIVIRRINGVYGLYVESLEDSSDEENGLWIGVERPVEGEVREIWLDLERDFTHVTKENMKRYYSAKKPTGLQNFNIWIGEEDIT